MLRRLVTLGVIAALLVGADVAARGFVSSAVSARAQQEAPPGSTASASVGGFPFLPPLVFGGRVDSASVHVENLTAEALVFASVDVTLSGVHLDRGRLFKDRKARITNIDSGTVRAVVTAEALSHALHGVAVTMTPGVLRVAGVQVTPRTVDGKLVVAGLTVPASAYMPCVSDVAVKDGEMELSCTIHEIPPALLDAVQSGR